MPLDVLIGYIAFDSVTTNATREQVYNFINRQTFNDTLKKIMRYWYKVTEWDCFRLKSYLNTEFYRYSRTGRSEILYPIIEKIREVSPTPFLDITLLWSHIIAHIKVTDTIAYFDTSVVIARNCYSVKAIVLDTIKGRILPSCSEYYGNYGRYNSKDLFPFQNPLPTQSCLVFDYCIDWGKGGIDSDDYIVDSTKFLLDSQGLPWIKAGREYIVFLETVGICTVDNGYFFEFLPLLGKNGSFSASMYPIENGFVIDETNEMGFGTIVPIDIFKSALRQRINEIKNF